MNENQIYVIPYIDQPKEFWDNLFNKYSPYIKEVYFPMPIKNLGTGRPVQPSEHLQHFIENDSIPKSVLLNPILLPRPIEEIGDNILQNLSTLIFNHNIVGVSVVNLTLAKIIKSQFPSIEVTASTLMDIFTTQQVLMIKDFVDVIVPSSRIVRDMKHLHELRAGFQGKIRLLVNESCLPSCVYRTQHFYEMSDFTNSHPQSLCDEMLHRVPWMRLTGSWILPQHLHFFDDIFDEIKIAGRVTLRNPKDYFEILDTYFFRKKISLNKIGGGPASIPEQLKITNEFYSYTLNCDKNCSVCNVCQTYWEVNL